MFVLVNNRSLVYLQLFIARKLFSDRDSKAPMSSIELIQGNQHALRFTRCAGKVYYETLK